MFRNNRALMAVLGAGSIVAGAWVFAGPINPPGGAVTSTGKTTQEIFDAVQGVNSTVTGAGRIAGVPGANTSAGTIELPAVGAFPKITTPILGLTFDLIYDPPSTGTGGAVTLGQFTVVRDLDQSSVSPFKALTTGLSLKTVIVKLTNPSGPITYKLTDAAVLRQLVTLVQRADGTFAQLESISFAMNQIDVTTASGTVNYDFVKPAAVP